MTTTKRINIGLVTALLFLPPLVCFSTGVPHPDIASIFITIIGLWLLEAVPLPVAGLLVPVLAAIYGSLPVSKVFDGFGSDILFLFLGCFLMGQSMEKHGFDKRLAYILLGRCVPGNSFFAINAALAFASYILSMWISNTSATAILTAVTLGILTSLNSQLDDDKTRHRVAVRLLLSCAFAASIGGLATPMGSPPNMIAIKLLSQHGIEISFLRWAKFAIPISLVMLAILISVLCVIFPLPKLSFPGSKEHFLEKLKGLGPMRVGEYEIAAIFFITVALWVLPGALHSALPDNQTLSTLNSRLSMSVVGLMGGLASFFLPIRHGNSVVPNLTWEETTNLEWGTLMLFGGGLTLGMLLEQSGTAAELGGYLFGGSTLNPYLLASAVVVTSIIMSEFASNTAAASILVPIIIGTGTARGASEETLTLVVLAATFAASFGFMLPVSTPPNAIVYGTGKVPAGDMRRAGIVFDIAGALLIIGCMVLVG